MLSSAFKTHGVAAALDWLKFARLKSRNCSSTSSLFSSLQLGSSRREKLNPMSLLASAAHSSWTRYLARKVRFDLLQPKFQLYLALREGGSSFANSLRSSTTVMISAPSVSRQIQGLLVLRVFTFHCRRSLFKLSNYASG